MHAVSHTSAYKGYRFGVCPECKAKAVYAKATVPILNTSLGWRLTPEEIRQVPVIVLSRCRKCGWEVSDEEQRGTPSEGAADRRWREYGIGDGCRNI